MNISACSTVYLLSLMVVIIGAVVSFDHFQPLEFEPKVDPQFLHAITRYDALHYRSIVLSGYSYDQTRRSNVAFFPAYPVLVTGLHKLTSIPIQICLLLVSNVAFFASVLLLARYTVLSYQVPGSMHQSDSTPWSIVVLAFLPTSFFFRFGYSESLFLLTTLVTLLSMRAQRNAIIVALLAGLSTATRPVGVAVAAAVCWYYLTHPNTSQPSFRARLLGLLWIAPLACWGILAYMGFLWWKFDDPLCFVYAQDHWKFLAPSDSSSWEKLKCLLTLEPVWNVYNPNSTRYWAFTELRTNPLNSMIFWNPILYLATWLVLLCGIWKRWITGYEIVLSLGLLLIPYVTRSYEMSMASHARFASVVIPQYLIVGRILNRLSPAVAASMVGLMAVILGLWTSLYVANYQFF